MAPSADLTRLLQEGLQALALNLSADTQMRLLAYVRLLVKWNAVYNLTAVRDPVDMMSKHVFDSLSIIPYLQDGRLLDVGTGAGLPGLLLALVCPQRQCVLLDSNAKKIRFVQQALLELKIPNAQAVCRRVDTFTVSEQETFGVIIARAFSSVREFYSGTRHLATVNTHWLAMKGLYPHDELFDLQDLPVTVQTIPLQVPYLHAKRHLVLLKQC